MTESPNMSAGQASEVLDPLAALPLTITPAGLDPNRPMLADIDTSADPRFSVSETAKLLGHTAHWVRWREPDETWIVQNPAGKQLGFWVFSGQKAVSGPHRTKEEAERHQGPGPFSERTEHDARYFTLSGLEAFILWMADQRHLSGQHAAYALGVVYHLALVYGYLSEDGSTALVHQPEEAQPE
jgi:hypothetical protein